MKKIIFMLSLMTASTFASEGDRKIIIEDSKHPLDESIPQTHSLSHDKGLGTHTSELTREFFFPLTKDRDSSFLSNNDIKHLISCGDFYIILQRSPSDLHDSLYLIQPGKKKVLISKGYLYPNFVNSNFNPEKLMVVWSNIQSIKPFKKTFYAYDATTQTNTLLELKDIKGKTIELDHIFAYMTGYSLSDIFVLGGTKFVEDRDEYWVNSIGKGWVLVETDNHNASRAKYTMHSSDSTLLLVGDRPYPINPFNAQKGYLDIDGFDSTKKEKKFYYEKDGLSHFSYFDDGKLQWSGTSAFNVIYSDMISIIEKGLGHKDFFIEHLFCGFNPWNLKLVLGKSPPIDALYDLKSKTITLLDDDKKDPVRKKLFTQNESLLSQKVHKTVKSIDGFEISYFLSTPPHGKQPFPLVMLIHGGPEMVECFGYEPEVQHLTSRGYAVAQVNFRGSFADDGYKRIYQWGRLMQQDLYSVLDHLIKEKTVDPENVAIMGYSYGGYATLMAATQKEKCKIENFSGFKCAIAGGAPTCLESLLKDTIADGIDDTSELDVTVRSIIGNYTEKDVVSGFPSSTDFLQESSPLYFAAHLSCPLFLFQGMHDINVYAHHAFKFSAALDKAGLKHTFVTFKGNHQSAYDPEEIRAIKYISEVFLGKHLKGGTVQAPDITDVLFTTAKFIQGAEDFYEFVQLLKRYGGWGNLIIPQALIDSFHKIERSIFLKIPDEMLAVVPYHAPLKWVA